MNTHLLGGAVKYVVFVLGTLGKNSRTVWGYSVRKTHPVVLVTYLNRTPIIQPLTQKRYSSSYGPYCLLYRERLVNTMHLEISLLLVIISISKAKFEESI